MYGTRKIREGKRTNGSECWSEEIRRVVGGGQGVRKIWMSIRD